MTNRPDIRRGAALLLKQMPWPNHPATILPGEPPELVPGERPGLGAFIVTATLTAIIVRVENMSFRLEPEGGQLGTRWVVIWVRREIESIPFHSPIRQR